MTADAPRPFSYRSIRIRVRIYGVVFLVLAVGVVASRMFHLTWDAVSGRVIGRLDVAGVVKG